MSSALGSSRLSNQAFGRPYTPSGTQYHLPYIHQHQAGNVSNCGSGMFPQMDESVIARMEASLAAVADIKSHHGGHPGYSSGHDMHYMTPKQQFSFSDQMQSSGSMMPTSHSSQFGPSLTQLTNLSMAAAVGHQMEPPNTYQNQQHAMYSQHAASMLPQMSMSHPAVMHNLQEVDCDPRELESFAERFKQRRIKLGVTQADVGKALGQLKLPGVGTLSQSTICRFESLTLSHNNMIALKPVLSAWLDDAERIARDSLCELSSEGSALDKKRKRTSIAAPEKRSLEAYFAIQPRPSGEKIAQIADKLDLKKNVVRVWFCNQRQKQKRMKFAAAGQM